MSTISIATASAKNTRGAFQPDPVTTTTHGAQIITGLGLRTIQRHINSGALLTVKVGGKRLIYCDSLMELLGRA
jgi:hypothetical protein